MPKVSMYTQAVLDLVGRMEAAEAAAKKAQPIPVMEEELQPHEIKARLSKMSDGGRRAFREQVGIEAMLKMTRGRGNG